MRARALALCTPSLRLHSRLTFADFDVGQRGFVYSISESFYGAFGCRAVASYNPKCAPLFADADDSSADLFYGNIVGPYEAAGFDTLESQCRIRQMRPGEWLIWANMGGYSLNNCESLDDDDNDDNYETRCDSPSIYFYASERDW